MQCCEYSRRIWAVTPILLRYRHKHTQERRRQRWFREVHEIPGDLQAAVPGVGGNFEGCKSRVCQVDKLKTVSATGARWSHSWRDLERRMALARWPEQEWTFLGCNLKSSRCGTSVLRENWTRPGREPRTDWSWSLELRPWKSWQQVSTSSDIMHTLQQTHQMRMCMDNRPAEKVQSKSTYTDMQYRNECVSYIIFRHLPKKTRWFVEWMFKYNWQVVKNFNEFTMKRETQRECLNEPLAINSGTLEQGFLKAGSFGTISKKTNIDQV